MVIRPLNNRTYCVLAAFTHFGALAKAVRLFTTSLWSQKKSYQTLFVNLPVLLQFEMETCLSTALGVEGDNWSGIGLFHSSPMGSFLLPLTHMVYLLPFLSYLAGPQKHFRPPTRPSVHPSDPETMTISVLEATASSCGKKFYGRGEVHCRTPKRKKSSRFIK